MRFLIDADLPRSTKPLLERYGHEAIDVRDIGLRHAEDPVIARYAQDHHACLISGDFGFADVRNYPPESYHGLVVLELPPNAGAKFMLDLTENFIQRTAILAHLPGRLAIVQAGRVRLRPV